MKVILYHQDCCGQCRAVEMLLKSKGIEYEGVKDFDVMRGLGINHTPVLDVDGNRLEGPAIVRWIKSNGAEK